MVGRVSCSTSIIPFITSKFTSSNETFIQSPALYEILTSYFPGTASLFTLKLRIAKVPLTVVISSRPFASYDKISRSPFVHSDSLKKSPFSTSIKVSAVLS